MLIGAGMQIGARFRTQLNAVRQDVLTQDWADLAKQFENLPGWWD